MQKNKQMQKNKRQNVKNVRSVIRQTVTGYAGLSLGSCWQSQVPS